MYVCMNVFIFQITSQNICPVIEQQAYNLSVHSFVSFSSFLLFLTFSFLSQKKDHLEGLWPWWENFIEDTKETGWKDKERFPLAQDGEMVEGCYEQGNKLPYPTKYMKYLDFLNKYQSLKNNCAPSSQYILSIVIFHFILSVFLLCTSLLFHSQVLRTKVDLETERTENTLFNLLVQLDTPTTVISGTFICCKCETVRDFQLLPASPPI